MFKTISSKSCIVTFVFILIAASTSVEPLHADSCLDPLAGAFTYGVFGDVNVLGSFFDDLSSTDGACHTGATLLASGSNDFQGDGAASVGLSIGHLGASAQATDGESAADGHYYDTITITGADTGASALFTLNFALSAEFVGEGTGMAKTHLDFHDFDSSFFTVDQEYDLAATEDFDPNNPTSITTQLSLTIGRTYYVDQFLAVDAQAGCLPSDDPFGPCTPQTMNVAATHSASFALVSDDPSSASFITASGCALDGSPCGSAPSTVPEPPTLVLIGIGLMGFGRARQLFKSTSIDKL